MGRILLRLPFVTLKIRGFKADELVKGRISVFSVIPAEAGIPEYQGLLAAGWSLSRT
jgi:hypothetical protein